MSEQQQSLEQAALESLVASDLSAKMSKWQQAPPPKPRRPVWPWLLAFCVVALTGWWWLKPTHKQQSPPVKSAPVMPQQQPVQPVAPAPQPSGTPAPTPDPQHTPHMALAQSFYKMPDFNDNIRGGGSPTTVDGITRAEQLLTNRKFDEALAVLQQLPKEYRTDALYLSGHAYFRQKKYAKAAGCFNDVKNSIKYGDAANWYHTLSLIPELDNKKDLIISQLSKIAADNGHPWQADAKRLLEKIKR